MLMETQESPEGCSPGSVPWGHTAGTGQVPALVEDHFSHALVNSWYLWGCLPNVVETKWKKGSQWELHNHGLIFGCAGIWILEQYIPPLEPENQVEHSILFSISLSLVSEGVLNRNKPCHYLIGFEGQCENSQGKWGRLRGEEYLTTQITECVRRDSSWVREKAACPFAIRNPTKSLPPPKLCPLEREAALQEAQLVPLYFGLIFQK